jgi:putative Mn2+ efflux pump MntP
MSLWELFLISIALSLDAFSVALSCGMRLPADRYRKFLKIALAFGLFQAIMPLLGSVLSKFLLARYIARYSYFISFAVFAALGLKTFYDFFTDGTGESREACACMGYRCLLSLAVATSIDAFLIGSVLGLKQISLPVAVTWIGAVTFLNSLVGCLLGNKAVGFLNRYSRILAGTILLALAVKSWF